MLCTVGFSEDLVKVDIKKLKKIYTSEIKSAFKNKVMTGYYDPDGGEKIYFTWIYDSNGDYFAESDFTGKVSGEWNVDTDKLCFNTMKVLQQVQMKSFFVHLFILNTVWFIIYLMILCKIILLQKLPHLQI